jgi:hypothetical protein
MPNLIRPHNDIIYIYIEILPTILNHRNNHIKLRS